jgi:hypothetical protein
MGLRGAARRMRAWILGWRRMSSARWTMAVALPMLAAVVAVCAVSVRADSTVAPDPAGGGLRPGLPRPGSSGPSAQEPARARDQERQHEAWLSRDQARSERADSRSRFARLDAGRALDAARSKYGPMVDAPAMNPLPLKPGDRAQRLDDESARVAFANGSHALAVGMGPLFSGVGTGSEQPIDVRLGQAGSGFAPLNPFVATSLPGSAGGEVRLGDGRGAESRSR